MLELESTRRSRRTFLWTGIAAAGFARRLGCSTSTAAESSIFDVHLHLPSSSGRSLQYYRVTSTAEDFERYLAACGVTGGVVSSMRSQFGRGIDEIRAGNREVARWVEKHRGFHAGCVVHPGFPDEALREIEECHLNLGFKWVGELVPDLSLTSWSYPLKGFRMVAEKVAELGLYLHVYAGDAEMASLLKSHPRIKWVFSPLGSSDLSVEQRGTLVRESQSAWVETSGLTIAKPSYLEGLVRNAHADRILFGSGFPQFDVCGPIQRVHNLDAPEEQKRQILWDNARRLLG